MTELAMRATLIIAFTICCAFFGRRLGVLVPRRILRVGIVALLLLPLLQVYQINWAVLNPFAAKPEPILIDEITALFYAPASAPAPSSLGWLAWFYGAGSVALILRGFWGLRQLRILVKSSEPAPLSTMIEADRCLALLGVKRTARILIGDVQSPITFGSMNPTIMLPIGFDQWEEHQRTAVLLHEAAHVRSFDCAWQRLNLVANMVYWCHPLFWSMSHAFKEETEVAADARAIAAGCKPADYATALVEIARNFSPKGGMVPALGLSFMNNRQLDRRVRLALRKGQRGFAFSGLMAICAAIFGSAAIAGVAIVNPEPEVVVIDAYLTEDPMDHLVHIVEENASGSKKPLTNKRVTVKSNPKPRTMVAKVSLPRLPLEPRPGTPVPLADATSHSIEIVEVSAPSAPEVPSKPMISEGFAMARASTKDANFATFDLLAPLAQMNQRSLKQTSRDFAEKALASKSAARIEETFAKAFNDKQMAELSQLKAFKDFSKAGFFGMTKGEPLSKQVIEITDEKGNLYRFEFAGSQFTETRVQVTENGKVILEKSSNSKAPTAPGRDD